MLLTPESCRHWFLRLSLVLAVLSLAGPLQAQEENAFQRFIGDMKSNYKSAVDFFSGSDDRTSPPASKTESDQPLDEQQAKEAERQQIATIQEHLNQLGYDAGAADGLMGPHTRSAIESFQRDQGLKVDGIPSATLVMHLQETDVPSAAPSATTTAASKRQDDPAADASSKIDFPPPKTQDPVTFPERPIVFPAPGSDAEASSASAKIDFPAPEPVTDEPATSAKIDIPTSDETVSREKTTSALPPAPQSPGLPAVETLGVRLGMTTEQASNVYPDLVFTRTADPLGIKRMDSSGKLVADSYVARSSVDGADYSFRADPFNQRIYAITRKVDLGQPAPEQKIRQTLRDKYGVGQEEYALRACWGNCDATARILKGFPGQSLGIVMISLEPETVSSVLTYLWDGDLVQNARVAADQEANPDPSNQETPQRPLSEVLDTL